MEISKQEIIEEQLEQAIDFYIGGVRYLCAITLAGATEEILGKILRNSEQEYAISEKYKGFSSMYEALFMNNPEFESDEIPSESEYTTVLNSARNDLKHLNEDAPICTSSEPFGQLRL